MQPCSTRQKSCTPASIKLWSNSRKTWAKNIFGASTCLNTIGEALSFIKTLRSREFDLVLDFQGLFKSGILTYLSGGKRRVGYNKTRELSYLFLNERIPPYNPELHAVERYLDLVRYLDGKVRKPRFSIPIGIKDMEYVKKFLYDNKGDNNVKTIAVCPGSRWATKLWHQERFCLLCDRIIDKFDASILFIGDRNDHSMIHAITSKMRRHALNTAGMFNLKELAFLLGSVDLMITPDTGPMHIASAMGTPVVAIFGPTAPWRTGPYGDDHKVLRSNTPCSPCFKKECDTKECMAEITVDRVFASVKEKLFQAHL